MAIEYPIGAASGGEGAGQIAQRATGDFLWVARWSDEITKDAAVDLKKLGQLTQHARKFHALTEPTASTQIFAALRRRLAIEGLEWPSVADMMLDIEPLRADLAKLYGYVKVSVPEVRSAGTLSLDPDDNSGKETPATLAKPHAVEPYVSAVRAHFI